MIEILYKTLLFNLQLDTTENSLISAYQWR